MKITNSTKWASEDIVNLVTAAVQFADRISGWTTNLDEITVCAYTSKRSSAYVCASGEVVLNISPSDLADPLTVIARQRELGDSYATLVLCLVCSFTHNAHKAMGRSSQEAETVLIKHGFEDYDICARERTFVIPPELSLPFRVEKNPLVRIEKRLGKNSEQIRIATTYTETLRKRLRESEEYLVKLHDEHTTLLAKQASLKEKAERGATPRRGKKSTQRRTTTTDLA